MSNETNESVGQIDEQKELTAAEDPTMDSPNAPAPNPPQRDIIAERMAQRMKERETKAAEAPRTEESSPAPETSESTMKPEPLKIELKANRKEPQLPEKIDTENDEIEADVKPTVSEILAEATEAMEAPAPGVSSRSERDPNRRREGDRNKSPKDRGERRPPREPRPERSQESSSQVSARSQGARQPRPERRDLADTPKEPRPTGPKSADNAFARARSLASKLGVSVVIPLLNEQDSLRELTAALREELFNLSEKNYEIIYVNDGSTDRSADILKDIVAGTSKVSTLTFRNNMGKSAALSVGFKAARFGIVVTMDADLQDDPKELTNLIAKLDEGFDLVSGWKKKRHDPISKTVPSKFFNSVTSFFSGIKLHDFNCGLKAYRKEVTDSLDVYGELHRYLPALAHWMGFRVTEIPVLHHPRKFGKSKFGTSRFFKGFLDLLSIVFTNRYGKRPLHLFGTIGVLMALVGLGINIYVSIEWAKGLTTLSNRPILLLGILLMMVGVQLISIGLLGEMIVKNAAKGHDMAVIKDKRPPRTGGRPADGRPPRQSRPGDERRSRGPAPGRL